MRATPRFGLLAVGFLLFAALAWVGWSAKTRSPENPAPETLRIAGPILPNTALHLIADAQGFWALEGLSVQLTPTDSGKAAMDLALVGAVDLAYAGDIPVTFAARDGKPMKIIASIARARNSTEIVARRDRGIRTRSDLAGKRLGVTPGTASDYFLWAMLVRDGINPATVTQVNVAPADMQAQITAGYIDAAVTWHPNLFNIQAALGSNGLLISDPDIYVLNQFVIAAPDLLRMRPGALQKYLRALLRAETFAQTHPEAALSIVAVRLGMSPSALRTIWMDAKLTVGLYQSQLITLEETARWARQNQPQGPTTLPSMLEYFQLDSLAAVAPGRVTVIH